MVDVEVTIKVPFHDVDIMEIAWHGHYAKYFEVARCALLDKIDYNYHQMRDSGYSWPVIDMRIRYARPCLFGQEIVVKASLVEWENRLKINYRITEKNGTQTLTKGYTTQVAVEMDKQEMQFISPAILFHKLGLEAE